MLLLKNINSCYEFEMIKQNRNIVYSKQEKSANNANSDWLIDRTHNLVAVNKKNLYFCGCNNQLIENLSTKLEAQDIPKSIKTDIINLVKKAYEKTEKVSGKDSDYFRDISFDDINNNEFSNVYNYLVSNPNNEKYADQKPFFINHDVNFETFVNANNTRHCALSESQLVNLKQMYNIYEIRQFLRKKFIKHFNLVKRSQELKPCKKEFNNIIQDLNKKISYIGLSEKTKSIVQKCHNDFNVELETFDIPELGEYIHDTLGRVKVKWKKLPDQINLTNFHIFDDKHSGSPASYDSGCYHLKYKDFPSLVQYFTQNDLINKRIINLNPYFLVKYDYIRDNNWKIFIGDDLRHEFGHFGNHLILGDKKYSKLENSASSFIVLLSPEEKKVFSNFIKTVDKHIMTSFDVDLDNFVDRIRAFLYTDELELSTDMILAMEKIIDKFRDLQNDINEAFALWPDKQDYAKTTTTELIAVAVEKGKYIKYKEKFMEKLTKFGMPEVYDI